MIRTVAKHSYIKGRKGKERAVAHVRYIQFRKGEDRDKDGDKVRSFFSRDDDKVSGYDVARKIGEFEGRSVVIHKLILSPGVEGVDMKQYTRELLTELGNAKGLDLDWDAVEHGNTAHTHAHVIVMGLDKNGNAVKFNGKEDYKLLRELGDRYLDRHHHYERYLHKDLHNLLKGPYSHDRGDDSFDRLLEDLRTEKTLEVIDKERAEKIEQERREAEASRFDKERAHAELPDSEKIYVDGRAYSKYSNLAELRSLDERLRKGDLPPVEKSSYQMLGSWIWTKDKRGEDYYERTGEHERLQRQFDEDLRRSLESSGERHRKMGFRQYLFESRGRLLESHERYEIRQSRHKLTQELKELEQSGKSGSDRCKALEQQLEWLNELAEEDNIRPASKKDKGEEKEVSAEKSKEAEKEREDSERLDKAPDVRTSAKEQKVEAKTEQPARELPPPTSKTQERPDEVVDKQVHQEGEDKEKQRQDEDDRERSEQDRRDQEARDREEQDRRDRDDRDREDREQRDRDERDRAEQERRDEEERDRERSEQERREKEERDKSEQDRRDQEERERLEQELRDRQDREEANRRAEEAREQQRRAEQLAREEAERLFKMQQELANQKQDKGERQTGTDTRSASQFNEKVDRYEQEIASAVERHKAEAPILDRIDAPLDLDKDIDQNWDLEEKLGDDKTFAEIEKELFELGDEVERTDDLEQKHDAADDINTLLFGDESEHELQEHERLPEEERIQNWEHNAFDAELIKEQGDRKPGELGELDRSQSIGDQERQESEQAAQHEQQSQQLQQVVQLEIQKTFFEPDKGQDREDHEDKGREHSH